MALAAGMRLGAFEIVGPLGAGGMGEVYRAWDPRLGRQVAVKVLPERHAGDAGRAARLRREAQAASRINHPNVVIVHDVGEQDGRFFLVSELVDGETLRHIFDQGPLTAGRVVDLGRQLAAGLGAAHDQGVVHRDLKPENAIVTTDGRLKILDFGIAHLVAGRSENSSATTETASDAIVGTSAYTSPEQARGHAVDERTDIFALGAILFEALTGERAFRGAGTVDTLTSVLRDDPLARPAARRLPNALRRVLGRCLAKEPAARFQSAHDLAFALDATALHRSRWPGRRYWASAAAALALGLGALAVWRFVPTRTHRVTAVAVLPLQSIGAPADAPEDLPLGFGLAEALIRRLAVVEGLEVRPVGSVLGYPPGRDPLDAGRRLGVDAVLDGTIQRSGQHLRLSVELLRVRDGRHLWSGTFEQEVSGLFVMQDELALRIAEALEPALSDGERRALTRHEANDPVAFENFLAGRYLWNRRDGESMRRAVAALELAVAREPGFARAHAALGDALAIAPQMAGADVYERARKHAREALRLDPELADAHLVLALIAHNHDLDWARADAEYRRALELEPSNAMALHRYGEILVTWGAFERGLALLVTARELDPVSPILGVDLAKGLWFARRFVEAEAEARAVLAVEPDYALAHAYRGLALFDLGQADAGVAALRRFAELDETPLSVGILGWGLARSGDRAGALAIRERLRSMDLGESGRDFGEACTSIGLGEADAALDALERAVEQRVFILGLDIQPFFAPLHGHPRFAALLRQVGLPYRPSVERGLRDALGRRHRGEVQVQVRARKPPIQPSIASWPTPSHRCDDGLPRRDIVGEFSERNVWTCTWTPADFPDP